MINTDIPKKKLVLICEYMQLKIVVEWHEKNTMLKPDTVEWEEYTRDLNKLTSIRAELIEDYFDRFRKNKVSTLSQDDE